MASHAEILELATQYHATGNTALAEQYAASILEDDPNHAGALHLLGVIAQQKGKLKEAIAYLNRSLTADGLNAEVWQQAGDILLAAGDVPDGITYYEQVLRLRPDFAEGYNTLGIALGRVGRVARAVECFQRATQLAPDLAPAHNNLGAALRMQRKWAEAAAAFEEALKLRPDSPDIAYNLGNTRFDQGDLNEAMASYRRALDLKPAYAADVCNSLATALRKQGRWDDAIAQYQEALRLQPGHGMALYNLSELAAAGRCEFPPEGLADAKEVVAGGRGEDAERILCAFAVGNLLNLRGDYDDAFRYYQEANDLQRRLFKRRNAAFNARFHEAQIDRIIADHGPAYFDRVKTWGSRAELPVFVVGMPCSGAALVEEVLAGHSEVHGAGEAGSVLPLVMQSAADKKAATTAELLPNIRAARTAAAHYLRHLGQLGQGATRVVVNSLDNVLALGMIATLFPGARVIHCRREPLDLALACYFQYRPDLAFACSLEDIGAYYLAHEKLMAHWARVLPLTIHDVSFEALIQDREQSARALIAYCGLDWDERCLTAPATFSRLSTSDSSHTAEIEGIGRSRHYRAHLGPLIKALTR
jgi:tetratricopeptide (TPR) repeat protein